MVHQLRKATESFAGQVRPECDADARRASEIATRLAQNAGLVTTQQAAVCETVTMQRASAREPGALHWLDRQDQRQALPGSSSSTSSSMSSPTRSSRSAFHAAKHLEECGAARISRYVPGAPGPLDLTYDDGIV